MPDTFSRNRVTWLMYLMLAFYGYFLNILGPLTPFLMDELKLNYTVSSLHFTAFAVGIILAGLGGHLVIDRLGRWNALWIGAYGMSLSSLPLMLGHTPVLTIGSSFLMGLIGSLVLAVVPSVLADQHGEQRAVAISEANVVASLVSAIAPLLVGWFAASAAALGGWRVALMIGFVAPLLMRLVIGKISLPARSANEVEGATAQPLPARYWVYWVALVLAVSFEFCMVSWSADYMEKSLGVAKIYASQSVSLFLGGMILGRFAGSRLVQRLGSAQVVLFSLLVGAVGFLLFWMVQSALVGAIGLFITGLGVASLYPMIISLAIGAAPGSSVQASARSSLASGTAIVSLPLVLGRLADAVGIHTAYAVVLLLILGVFVIIQATTMRAPAGKPAAS